MEKKKKQAWEPVKDWYDDLVGDEGHYYHKSIIIPKVIQKLKKWKINSLLDLACGQGVLSRQLPNELTYVGVDLSPSLVDSAKKRNRNQNHTFIEADACSLGTNILKKDFDCITLILAIQDIENLKGVLKSAYKHLKSDGKFVIVMNHPCFRIPRQSNWDYNEKSKILYRRIGLYMSEIAIPIKTNPGKKQKSPTVEHFHRPLSTYFHALNQAGFIVENISEWTSNKESYGKRAKAENRARKEFPLFLSLTAGKH